MPQYKIDSRDIEFNLFELLKVQSQEKFGMGLEDYKGIIEEFSKFIGKEIFPTREKSDEVGVTLNNGEVKVPEILQAPHKAYYENGWFALGMPEQWGGAPVPESISNTCLSVMIGANPAWSMYPSLTRGALNVILMKGSEEQKSTYVPPIIEGRWGGSMCLTEPGAGSDVGALLSTAKPLGDGKYQINGVKIFISSGDNDLYDNMVHLVLARTPEGVAGTKGISLFIVPKFKVNPDGSLGEKNDVVCTKIEHKMGIHASATCELTFGANGVCEGHLIGEEFEGMSTMFIMMNEARLMVALQGESQANLAYELALQYAKERKQFNTEIINLPDVKRNLLKMRAMSRGLRAICTHAADLIDQTHEGVEGAAGELGIFIPICKSYSSDQGFLVASEAVQVHGGYGFCTEYGVEQFIRDTKIAAIYEGTNGIQAMDLLMRKVLKDKGTALGALIKKIMATTAKLEKDFSTEQALFGKVLASGQKVMESLTAKAMEKKIPQVLQHCTDFLEFMSRLVVAWKLADSALLAKEKLDQGSNEKEFYESKIVDFKIFCQHYLIHNIATAKTITDLEMDIHQIEL